MSSVDRYKLWGLKRGKTSSQGSNDDDPSLTDSEQEEEKDESLLKIDLERPFKLDENQNMPPGGVPGFGGMIKNFWSKYVYNGFNNTFNKNRMNHVQGIMDDASMFGNKMFEEYPDFQNEVDLMKDINQNKDFEAESEFDLGMEIDGLEKL